MESNIVATLTDSADAGVYWRKLKQRLNEEGIEVVTFCHGLKLSAPDGKQHDPELAKGWVQIVHALGLGGTGDADESMNLYTTEANCPELSCIHQRPL